MRELKKNVILITIDAFRADHLGCLGYAKKTTPYMDKIAREGVLFSNAFSYGSNTLTSVMPMMTSSPFIPYFLHGIDAAKLINLHDALERYKEIVRRLYSLKVTIAGALREQGYETAAFHSNPFLTSYFGYGKDFLYFDDSIAKYGIRKKIEAKAKVVLKNSRLKNLVWRLYSLIYRNEVPYVRAEAINKKAISWLRTKKPEKFFVWLHYMDTHIPYKPPKSFRPSISSVKMSLLNRKILNREYISDSELSQAIELYDGSIRYVDYSIKCLLEELNEMGILENTIVVITADHGEEFKDHGGFIHEPTKLYDELTHIPLIIYNTEYKNITIDETVSSIDIAPTMMGMLNLPNAETFQGRCLLPITESGRSYGVVNEGGGVQALTGNLKMIVAYRTKRWKYIQDEVRNRKELYDMKRDPKETENLYEVERDVAEDLESRIRELILHQGELVAMDVEKEKIRRKLKKLKRTVDFN